MDFPRFFSKFLIIKTLADKLNMPCPIKRKIKNPQNTMATLVAFASVKHPIAMATVTTATMERMLYLSIKCPAGFSRRAASSVAAEYTAAIGTTQ